MTEPVRKLAAIMFTDLVGYSALTERDESLSMQVLAEYRAFVRPCFERHRGREIRSMGDGFLVEFASAVEAVAAAIDIQRTLWAANRERPQDRRIVLRIGIHAGDVVEEGADVYGTAVNIAARIEPLAPPGGICVTRQVVDQVRSIIENPMTRMGAPPLKNIETPVEVFQVVLPWMKGSPPAGRRGVRLWVAVAFLAVLLVAAVVGTRAWTAMIAPPSSAVPASAAPRSLAVLPLVNFSGDPGQDYFADGMTDVLITQISAIRALKVISRTSSMKYKGSAKTLPQIARELGVDAVVEGSVAREGERVEITARLVDARSDRNLWTGSYQRTVRDIMPLQREVARTIVHAVRIRLTPGEEAALARTDGAAPDAYDAYLNGLYHWNKRTKADMEESVRLFQEALDLDPRFAPAHAGLANAYSVLADWGYAAPAEVYPKVKELAARALELDPSLAEGHTAMASYHHYAWEWEASEAEFRKSIEARPSYATAHQWLAELLIVRGQLSEAVAEAGRACELDPLSLAANLVLGLTRYHARDYDGAIAQFRHTLELDPAFVARGTLWLSLIQKGRYDEAVREYAKTLEAYGAGPEKIAEFQQAYKEKGIRGCWQWLIDTGISLTGQTYSEPYYFATYYSLLGQNGRALDRLDEALDMHSGHIGYIATDPALDNLRGEPRFRAMLDALHLAGVEPPAKP